MISIRESFGAKLLSAMLGTVGLLLMVTFVSVRVVTDRQLETETARTMADATRLFAERDRSQRETLARLSASFTTSRRAVTALDAAIKGGDVEYMAGNIAYELDLQRLDSAVVVLTDDRGLPVLSIVDGRRVTDGDPIGVGPTAAALLDDPDEFSLATYRLFEGTVYTAETVYLGLGPRAVGTVTVGLPVNPSDIEGVRGDVDPAEGAGRGFEACLVFGARCVVRTRGVSEGLEAAMLDAAGTSEPHRIRSDGDEWSLQAASLGSGSGQEGQRVVAVPLGPVLRPFETIVNALLLSGLVALLLAVVAGRALSRNLTQPVRALVDATGRVADGDYDAVVQTDSTDEMGTLAHAFNEMTRGLRVREQYRSVLSKVVSKDVAEELMRGEVELGGENREMSVLFADVRGFTSLTEGMEPQAVIVLLNECMEVLASAVDAEDGVVDKFIGDEVMAVFGAPVAQPDHALRAVSAAVRMRDGIEAMNDRRVARGEQRVGVGIGVASGMAVAGNMGSSDRMNYTVLGTTVNLASRLTGEASAGEIMISDSTLDGAGAACLVTKMGAVSLKGFSNEVDVHRVDGIDRTLTRSAPTAVHRALRSIGMAFLLGGSTIFANAADVSAQWPTLRDVGVGYLSEDGRYQIDLSGQLDLEALYFHRAEDGLSGLAFGSGPLFAPRARLFLDVFVGDHLYGLVEVRGDRGEAPTADLWEARVEQAYLSAGTATGSLQLQAGIFPNPFGGYAQRHLTVVDPFLRPPLPYDYRTVVSRQRSPSGADSFVGWRDDPTEWRRDGAPPVWGVPYQWGVMAVAEAGVFRVRLAGMNSAPSSEPVDWYHFGVVDEPSWVARVEATLTPELSLGGSYNVGPYVRTPIPNGPEPSYSGTTYDQRLWGVDASFARGPLMIRGEFLHDSWDVPNVTYDAVDVGYTLEVQADVAPGWSVATRVGRIDFRELGPMGDWDWDVDRLEVALGYRITLNAGLLASWSTTWDASSVDPDGDLTGVRLWWAF